LPRIQQFRATFFVSKTEDDRPRSRHRCL